MTLSSQERQSLKQQAHHLKPVVRIGQHGLSEGVVTETHRTLNTHELIKVHIQHGERAERLAIAQQLCTQTQAQLVHHIGKVFILYRKRDEDADA